MIRLGGFAGERMLSGRKRSLRFSLAVLFEDKRKPVYSRKFFRISAKASLYWIAPSNVSTAVPLSSEMTSIT